MSNPFKDWTPAMVAQFNSKRFKTEEPNPAASFGGDREDELHDLIMDHCRSKGWIFFHGAMSARTHRTLGEFDFIILADNGRVILVECKSRTGKLSQEQQAIHVHSAALGHAPHVIRTMDEFLKICVSPSV